MQLIVGDRRSDDRAVLRNHQLQHLATGQVAAVLQGLIVAVLYLAQISALRSVPDEMPAALAKSVRDKPS